MMTREEIESEALKWVGTPYLHQGRSRRGIDCIGLAFVIAWHFKLSSFDKRDYDQEPDGALMKALCDQHLRGGGAIDQVGSVLLMRFTKESPPQHVAIRTSYGIVHSYARCHRCVQVRFSDQWRKRVVGVYDFPGVA